MASDPADKRYLFDNPANVRRVVLGLIIACLLLLGLDLVIHRHAVHPWEGVFGFYALYGFAAYVVLVLVAKLFRRFLMRPEDYYAPLKPDQDQAPGGDTP